MGLGFWEQGQPGSSDRRGGAEVERVPGTVQSARLGFVGASRVITHRPLLLQQCVPGTKGTPIGHNLGGRVRQRRAYGRQVVRQRHRHGSVLHHRHASLHKPQRCKQRGIGMRTAALVSGSAAGALAACSAAAPGAGPQGGRGGAWLSLCNRSAIAPLGWGLPQTAQALPAAQGAGAQVLSGGGRACSCWHV